MVKYFLMGGAPAALLFLAGGAWLIINYLRAECVESVRLKSRPKAVLLALLPLIACLGLLAYNVMTVLVAIIYLIAITMAVKLCCFLLKKIFRFSMRRDITLAIGLFLTATILCFGYVNMHNVRKTEYTVSTEKALPENGLRIALISDIHLSTCVDGAVFRELLGRIAADKPDMLLICGDLTDDSSKPADLDEACAALGDLQLPRGVWFAFGNHDIGAGRIRAIHKEDLQQKLEQAGIGILEDGCVELDGIALAGRNDKSVKSRKSAAELISDIGPDTFTVLMDHQPNDFEGEAASGADLVLCGHTHGGQIFPAGQIGMLLHANDLLYGKETRGNTVFIVSSGVSGWAIPFKTSGVSEYVLIDVVPAA